MRKHDRLAAFPDKEAVQVVYLRSGGVLAIISAMSTVTGWFPLVLTTFFGGAVGSLVTTYGSQTGERRKARSQVRTELHHTSSIGFHKQNKAQLVESLNNFEITAMLAGLPEMGATLYNDSGYTVANSATYQRGR